MYLLSAHSLTFILPFTTLPLWKTIFFYDLHYKQSLLNFDAILSLKLITNFKLFIQIEIRTANEFFFESLRSPDIDSMQYVYFQKSKTENTFILQAQSA